MNNGFSVPAQLMGVNLKADKSVGLRFTTGELTSEEKVSISDYQLEAGWLLFAENPIKDEEIPKELAETGQKTQSKRLRDVLFVLWKQNGEQGAFQNFYNEKMEKLINLIKDKLE